MSRLFIILMTGALLTLGSSAAWAQAIPPLPHTGAPVVDEAVDVVNGTTQTVENLEKAGVAAAQSAANHIVPGSGDFAKGLVDGVLTGNPLGALIGPLLGGLEKKLLEALLEQEKLKERLTALEGENAKKDIEIAHAKAQFSTLNAQMVQLNAAMGELNAIQDRQLVALQARIDELERTKGTVTTPFKVVDGSGFPLVLIDETAATFTSPDGSAKTNISLKEGLPAQLYLGNMAGGVSLEGGETNRFIIVSGETAVFQLKQDAEQGIMMTGTTAEGSFELGSGPQLVGLMIKKDDQPAAGLGTFDGRAIALRVFAAGAGVIGAIGENPNTPGTGIAYVGNGTQNAAALAVMNDGSGIVHAFAADGTVGSGLIGGDRMVAAYNAAGNAVVTIGKSENSDGGNVTARDAAGEGVFRAGYNSVESGGDACVYRAKKQNTYCLGIGAPMMGVGMF